MDKIVNIDIIKILEKIHEEMLANKELLIALDSVAGDGDLGISMCQGFKGVLDELAKLDTASMIPKKIILKAAMAMNEYSPSSLGTIICVGMMGGAKKIGNKESLGVLEYTEFLEGVLDGIMTRAKSKRGEKTILDSIGYAYDELTVCLKNGSSLEEAAKAAARGGKEGMEKTKEMIAVHGRAAYYQEKSIGNTDGGATVGMLIFKVIDEYINN